MKFIDIKDPAGWHAISDGDMIEVPVGRGVRKFKLELNTTEPLTVLLASSDDMSGAVLMAHDYGNFQAQASVSQTAYVQFKLPNGGLAFFRSFVGNMLVNLVDEEVLTTLEPTRRNTEFDRMRQFVKMNEKRRDAQLAAVAAF